METQKHIRISCSGHSIAALEEFNDFQGDLKTLGKNEAEQLRNEILLNGFSFPLFAWEHDGVLHLLDGHQRVKTLRALQEEGYTVPKIPYDPIQADSYSEAKGKLLAATSQYGKLTDAGLAKFLESSKLDPEALASRFSLPNVNFGKVLEQMRGVINDDGDLGEGTKSTTPTSEKLPSSHVRMAQLFFNEETHREFLDLTGRLDSHYGVGNLTDIVLEAIRADFKAKYPNG